MMFKAEGSVIESQLEKGMAVKTVDRAFLQRQQSAELFRAAIKSQATRDPYERRANWLSIENECKNS